jgi:hypothetical protein
MLPSLPLYLAFLLCCSAVLLWHAFRADRVLGWTLVLALAANLTGAGLMDWWVRTMHRLPAKAQRGRSASEPAEWRRCRR